MNRKLPTPEEVLYGQEMFNAGYSKGYKRAFWDINKLKRKKEGKAFKRFGEIWDRMEDILADNRRK